MDCLKYDDSKLEGEDREIKELLDKSYHAYNKKPIIRLLMTAAGVNGRRSHKEWRSWAEMILNSSLDDVTLADAQMLASETLKLEESIKRIPALDENSVKGFLIKTLTLPVDLYKYHGLGSLHEIISDASAEREFRVGALNSEILALKELFGNLTGSSIRMGQEAIRSANEEVEVANARYSKLIKQRKAGANIPEPTLVAAQKAKDAAAEKMHVLTRNIDGNEASRVLRLVAERLNGDIKSDQELTARLGKSAKFESVKNLIATAERTIGKLSGILETASTEMYDMMRLELEPLYGAEEAAEIAAKLTKFEKEESYYPHKNLISLMNRVNNVIETRKLSNEADAKSTIREFASKARTAHAIKRKGGKSLIDYDVLTVLENYGREVYDHAFAARVGQTSQRFINELFKLDSVAGRPDTSPEVMYANSVRKLIVGHMEQMFNRKMSTTTDEALGVITALQILTKLTSPSTSITNRLEGVIQYMSYNGIQNIKRAEHLSKIYESQINEAMSEAGIEFSAESGFDATANMSRNEKLRDVLTIEELHDLGIYENIDLAVGLNKTRGKINNVSNFILNNITMWTKAENANRREAFRISAAEAAHFVTNKWEAKFLSGQHTDHLVNHYNLNANDAALAKKGNKSARGRLWLQFRNKYIMRHGYRGMFQTQFQYSESARNFTDLNAKTSWLTMFQHYPRSLASAVVWAMHDVKSLYQVGGLAALGRRTTGKSFGRGDSSVTDRLINKTSINHSLQHVLTLGGISSLRAMVRGLTGIQLTNALAHPAGAILSDLFSYFVDDEPASKREKAHELLFGYNQPIRQVTGPTFSDVADMTSWFGKQLDFVSFNSVLNGVNDGSMADYLAATLGVMGMKPTEDSLTNKGRRQYGTAFDVLREHTLNAFAIKNRSTALVSSVIQQSPKDILYNVGRMGGIRIDWKQVKDNKQKTDKDKDGRV